jgi:hypothetical protein
MDRIVTTSWDDGGAHDLRLAQMLGELGIAGTFYVAPQNREREPLAPASVRRLDEHFEVGGHSLTHADLPKLAGDELRRELEVCKAELEDAIGNAVTAFSYPFGHYDRRVRAAVAGAGFRVARTTRMLRTAPARDPLLVPTSLRAHPDGRCFWLLHCVRTAHPAGVLPALSRAAGGGWVEMGLHLFERVMDRGGVWHLWGHSWELEERGLWDDLRRLLTGVAGHAEVRYVPNSVAVSGPGRPGSNQ